MGVFEIILLIFILLFFGFVVLKMFKKPNAKKTPISFDIECCKEKNQ